MAVVNGYCDVTDLKSWLGISDSNSDAILEIIIGAASRAIDRYCGRRFFVDSGSGTKDYFVSNCHAVEVHDFVVASGVTVTVDDTGDGTYETTFTSGTDYYVQPVNRERNGITYWPGESLIAIGAQSFPQPWTSRPTVRVNATWGWQAIPDEVRQACLLKAARLFRRQQTPEGIAGGSEFGAIRISNKEDPDVCMLLAGFRKGGEAAGLTV